VGGLTSSKQGFGLSSCAKAQSREGAKEEEENGATEDTEDTEMEFTLLLNTEN
jgi:hypothetical protein